MNRKEHNYKEICRMYDLILRQAMRVKAQHYCSRDALHVWFQYEREIGWTRLDQVLYEA